jgi:hypothetical protein
VLGEDAGFEVSKSDIDTVCRTMGIWYDIPYRIMYIPNWLKWNQPESSKVLIGYIKSARNLPKCEITDTISDTLSHTLSHIESMRGCDNLFSDLWEQNYKPKRYDMPYHIDTPEPYPEPKPEPDPKPYPDIIAPAALVSDKPKQNNVQQVFDYWALVMGHPKARLDTKRQKTINAALKIGYSVADLKQAIDGNKASKWHQGQNKDKKVFDSLDLILRNAEQIDKFVALADGRGTNEGGQTIDQFIAEAEAQARRVFGDIETEKVVG